MPFDLKTSRQAFDDVIDRIRALLSKNDPSSDEFFELLDRVGKFILIAKDDLKQLQATARDPLVTRKESETARELSVAVNADLERLEASQEMLEKRAEELRSLEGKASDKAAYDAVRIRRDGVVKLIKEEFPKISGRLSDLCKAIVNSNEEIDRTNENLPEDCAPLDRAEGLARGFADRDSYETQTSITTFRIIQSVFPGTAPQSVAWPPSTHYQLQILNHRRGFTAREAIDRYLEGKKKGGSK